MLKIFKSLFVVTAIAVVAGTATWSHFTHTKTINNNTFSAGTVKISLENPNGALPFDIDNLAPGDVTELRLDIENEGSLDATVKGEVSGKWDHNGKDEYIKIIDQKYWNGTIWKSFDSDLPIEAGKILKTKIFVEFDIDADNSYQNKTYRGTLDVEATQKDNAHLIGS